MAAMSTVLTVEEIEGGRFTYSTSGSTAAKPKQVVTNRKVPNGNQAVSEFMVSVSHATEDDDGSVLPNRAAITISVKQPKNGQTADMTNVLAIARDIVASDEFANSVTTLQPLSS